MRRWLMLYCVYAPNDVFYGYHRHTFKLEGVLEDAEAHARELVRTKAHVGRIEYHVYEITQDGGPTLVEVD